MSSQQNNPENPTANVSQESLRIEEVVQRLDQLWPDHVPPQPLPGFIGQQVGRYQIEKVLGRGAFGVVYLAQDPQLDRQVALKIPRPEVLVDDEKRKRFENEASATASLDHPMIVPLLEASFDGPIPFIASAYCPGPDLAEWLEQNDEKVCWKSAARFITQLAEAVHHAHEKGTYHRDIKPSNIMLQRKESSGKDNSLQNYSPRLTDFGLAQLASSQLVDTRSSLLIGTPLYMAPEQLESPRHRDQPEAIDVYALGCLLFELLTGRPPIEGASYIEMVDRLREAPPERLRKLRKDVPRSLDSVCAKCLEKNPAARYQSAKLLAADLNACAEEKSIAGASVGFLDRFRYWCGRPQRIRDAGLYAMSCQILMTLWIIISVAGLWEFKILTQAENVKMLGHLALAVFPFCIPMIIIGWHTMRGRSWAIYAGLAFSVPYVILQILGLANVGRLFDLIYRDTPFHAYSIYTFILLIMLGQLALYSIATRVHRKASLEKPSV